MNIEHFFKIYYFVKQKKNFIFFFFMLKLDEPFKDQENFKNCSFFNSSVFGFERKKVILSLDPDPWIRIFLRIRDPGSQTVANPTDPESKALV